MLPINYIIFLFIDDIYNFEIHKIVYEIQRLTYILLN